MKLIFVSLLFQFYFSYADDFTQAVVINRPLQ